MSMDRRHFLAMAPAFPTAAMSASLTLREEGKPDINLDLSVLKLQPGDVLVLTVPGSIHDDTAAYIKASVAAVFHPKDIKVMVMSDGLSVAGVLRGPA